MMLAKCSSYKLLVIVIVMIKVVDVDHSKNNESALRVVSRLSKFFHQ